MRMGRGRGRDREKWEGLARVEGGGEKRVGKWEGQGA